MARYGFQAGSAMVSSRPSSLAWTMASAGRQKSTSSFNFQMFLTVSAMEAFITANWKALTTCSSTYDGVGAAEDYAHARRVLGELLNEAI